MIPRILLFGLILLPNGGGRIGVAPALDRSRLLAAFERVESSGRLHSRGDGGKSWGLFQFQKSRWIECRGTASAWGAAERGAQERVMRQAVARYLQRAPVGATIEQAVIVCGRAHNGGQIRLTHNGYTRRLWTAYKAVQP